RGGGFCGAGTGGAGGGDDADRDQADGPMADDGAVGGHAPVGPAGRTDSPMTLSLPILPKTRAARRGGGGNRDGSPVQTGRPPWAGQRLGQFLADVKEEVTENLPNAFPPRRTPVPQPGEAKSEVGRIMGFFTDT